MSSPVLVNDITAMSHRFAIHWNISARALAEMSSSDKSLMFRSNRYHFKNIENLEFSIHLIYDELFKIRVNCEIGMPIFLEDALILIKDRLYRVQCTPTNAVGRLIFDGNVLEENSFEDDKVTIHCIMSIPAQVKAMIPNPSEDKLAINDVECESIVTVPDLFPYGYDAVSEFEYSGRIPDFNVNLAVRLTSEAHQRNKPILKALCLEYLMDNLTTENVAKVLKQAVDCNATQLLQKCANFLAEKCKITPVD